MSEIPNNNKDVTVMFRSRSLLGLSVLCVAFLTSGCSNMVRNMAGSGMVSFGNNYITPWFMASEDTDVMCAMGEGMAAMTFPLEPATDVMVPMLTLASGMCADERSKEEELRYIRAMRKNDTETAQDARTMQKRWAEVAARRQYFGYQATVRHFGEPGDKCPDFDDRNDEMSYLFGLLGGLQAFQTDLANGGTVGVPMDTMPKVFKGLECVKSDEFWGMPEAVMAAATIMKSNIGGDKENLAAGVATLKKASAFGESQGVRMVQLMEATVYTSLGDEEKTKAVIREHVASKKKIPPNPELKLLDEMATRGIKLISDKMWTQATGQRTPFNALGTFWDDKSESTGLDIDDLL
ncbi:conserved hypothetical protein [gamma proteobacterium HdN1]|nr:conserved hypothetical protein [gamma proteobacterium HdN1]